MKYKFTKKHKENISKALKGNPKLIGNQYWKLRNQKLASKKVLEAQTLKVKEQIANSVSKLWKNKEYKENQIKKRLGKLSHRKGKTMVEEYGEEKAKKLINNLVERNKGKKYSDKKNKKKGRSGNLNVSKRPDVREKLRLKAIERTENQIKNGLPKMPNIGKYEIHILNNLEKCLSYKILRQHRVAGYFLDGYCPALNLAIEIDEFHHKNQLKKDLERQKIIERRIDCKFLRIRIPK